MKNERIISLDYVRVLAIILVILLHCFEASFNVLKYNYIKSILFFIGRLGVPLFLFLTGALVLSKRFDSKEDIRKFYKNNFIPLVISIEFVMFLYYVFLVVLDYETFNIKYMLEYLMFFKKMTISSTWYMPMIIGIYFIIPFLSIIVHKFDIKDLKYILLVSLFFNFLLPTSNIIFTYYDIGYLKSLLDLNYVGSCYGFYIVLGYYIYNKKILRNINNKYLLLVFLISSILGVISQIVFKYNVWYNSIFILLSSLCLIELILRLNIDKKLFNRIISYISAQSFAIYSVHVIIIQLLKRLLYLSNSFIFKFNILFIVTSMLSLLIIYILNKSKYMKRLLLIK